MTQETTMAQAAVLMADVSDSSSTLEEHLERHHKNLLHAPVNNLHETVGFVAGWLRHLPKNERDVFEKIILQKYIPDGATKAYAIALCGEAKLHSCAPKLYELLCAELDVRTDRNTSSLVIALGGLHHAPAFPTIKALVNSQYSLVAVHSLARINFAMAVPHINNAMAGHYAEWEKLQDAGRIQRLALLFADLMYDAGNSVGPKAVLEVLETNKDRLEINPMWVRDAFSQAFDFYVADNGVRRIQPKRAHYYAKQVPRILSGMQGTPLSMLKY